MAKKKSDDETNEESATTQPTDETPGGAAPEPCDCPALPVTHTHEQSGPVAVGDKGKA